MAAAFFNRLSSDDSMEAVSAGTQPAEKIHPEVIEVMRELDIDLSGAQPQLLTEELAGRADLLITMGCGEACPYVPGLRRLDWPLRDPKGQSLDDVRAIRDEIKERVRLL
ncbi:arsenate reductase ArsC, partial [bacterium]|nr:arsenate reductase ArsC [bacterium]